MSGDGRSLKGVLRCFSLLGKREGSWEYDLCKFGKGTNTFFVE